MLVHLALGVEEDQIMQEILFLDHIHKLVVALLGLQITILAYTASGLEGVAVAVRLMEQQIEEVVLEAVVSSDFIGPQTSVI
jgi:hypothetical protein